MIKYCPDLIGYEEVKPMSRCSGYEKMRVPKQNCCIGKICVAYKNGKCNKYNNEVELKEND